MARLTLEHVEVFPDDKRPNLPESYIFEEVSYKDLKRKMKIGGMKFNEYFAFFKMVTEEPKKAERTLKKLIKNQENLDVHLFNIAKKGELKTEGKLLRGIQLFIPDRNMIYMFGTLKRSNHELLRNVENDLKELYSKVSKYGQYLVEGAGIKTILNALETGDFSERGKYYIKEEIEVPDDIDVTKDTELATYFASKMNSRDVRVFRSSVTGYCVIGVNGEKILIESDDNGKVKRVYKSLHNSARDMGSKVIGIRSAERSLSEIYNDKQDGYIYPEESYTDEDIFYWKKQPEVEEDRDN